MPAEVASLCDQEFIIDVGTDQGLHDIRFRSPPTAFFPALLESGDFLGPDMDEIGGLGISPGAFRQE